MHHGAAKPVVWGRPASAEACRAMSTAWAALRIPHGGSLPPRWLIPFGLALVNAAAETAPVVEYLCGEVRRRSVRTLQVKGRYRLACQFFVREGAVLRIPSEQQVRRALSRATVAE